jgi:hypothetical protein
MDQVTREAAAMGLDLKRLTEEVQAMGLDPATVGRYAEAYLFVKIEEDEYVSGMSREDAADAH